MKVLIIDDEQPARELIRHYLSQIPEMEVLGECANGFEALRDIQRLNPDLIILDIRMPRISGFELLELLENPPMVIFSTAYDDYAIRAFEENAVDYLLKPYSASRFQEALSKALTMSDKADTTHKIKDITSEMRRHEHVDRLVIREGNQIEIVPFGEIEYIEASGDYVEVHADRGIFRKQITMKELEEVLPDTDFLRIHRSYIARLDCIRKIEPYSRDAYLAVMNSGDQVSLSRNGYHALRRVLDI